MTAKRTDVPANFIAQLRLVCLDLPETHEENAWVGTRWMVRKKNFSHVLMIEAGWPPAYARAAALTGRHCVLTFRVPGALSASARFCRRPFFKPVWWPNIVGLEPTVDADWDEIG